MLLSLSIINLKTELKLIQHKVTQLKITYSNSAIETLEKGVKYV